MSGNLRDLIVRSANLYRLSDKLPSGVGALQARLNADLETISKILRSEGYYAYRIDHRLDAQAKPAKVTIRIDTGPWYRIEAYGIRYADPKRAALLPSDPAAVGIELGQQARSEAIVDAQTRLLRRAGELGHPFATVVRREVVVDHRKRSVVATLEVDAGPSVTFGALTVEGNERVTESYIRRLADIPVGSSFNLATVDETRRRLFDSGLFETVTIDWPDQPTGTGDVPLTVKVIERERRSVAFGLNYSSTDGAGADVSWTHRNLFGRAERLEVGSRIAQRELSAYVDFVKPTIGRVGQDFTSRAEAKSQETEAFDQTSILGSVGLRRRLSDEWDASLAMTVEASEIEEPGEPAEQFVIFSLPGQLSYDGTDDLLDPSEGARLTFGLSPSKSTGDSSATFLLGSVGGSVYHEVIEDKRLILAARARFASIVGAERDEIPASRRLYAGGGGSIRGYEFQTVGPLDSDNDPLGGLSVFETSLEARIRVYGDFGIVPFVEGGSAFEDSVPSGSAMRWAAGLGFLYYTAIGPLRVDFAVPLNPRPDIDDSFAFYISLGQAF